MQISLLQAGKYIGEYPFGSVISPCLGSEICVVSRVSSEMPHSFWGRTEQAGECSLAVPMPDPACTWDLSAFLSLNTTVN